jgi:hypothetical protein
VPNPLEKDRAEPARHDLAPEPRHATEKAGRRGKYIKASLKGHGGKSHASSRGHSTAKAKAGRSARRHKKA